MRYRILDSNGDMSFGNNQLNFYKDSPEAVAQLVQTRLKLWLNEWYLNVEDGTPWLQGVIGKQQLSTVELVLRSRIVETEGVLSLSDFYLTIDPDTRKLSVSGTIDTIFGATTFGQVI